MPLCAVEGNRKRESVARRKAGKLKKMKVLIVDDEPLARGYLRRLLEAQEVEILAELENATEALHKAEDLHPDLLFLDIQMPGMTGMQMATALQSLEAPPLLVFVTGYSEYALAAFEHESIDYLLKPVSADRLARTLVRARALLADRRLRRQGAGEEANSVPSVAPATPLAVEKTPLVRLPIREDYSVRLLRVEEILCAAAREKRVFIITATGEHRTYYTLKQLETILPSHLFFRVHDSYIVRIDLVKELHLLGSHSYALRMENGLLVPVGRARYRELQSLLGLDSLPSS